METVGEIIIKVRKDFGLSQKDLAAKLRVDPVYLCNIEKNHIIPNIDDGAKISSVLHINQKEFIFLILRTKYPHLSHIFQA
jgi:ribosome-binding protein aMBF1 (putative translation factor)